MRIDSNVIFQLVKVGLLSLSAVVCAAATAMPWWFTAEIPVSRDGGATMETTVLNLGLFYLDQGKIIQTDLIFVDKATNAHVVPDWFKMAQLFFGLGSMALWVCVGMAVLYFVREHKTATGEICLAGTVTPSAICLLLGLAFSLLGTIFNQNAKWEQFPVPNFYNQAEAHPHFGIDFVFFVAAAGVLFAIGAAVVSWIYAIQLCGHVETVRYQMLTAPLTEEERGVGAPGMIYKFPRNQPPNPGFRYDGYSKPAEATISSHAVDI